MKNQKLDKIGNQAEEINAGSDGHSSSSYTREDDNASALNFKGKTKASKGATDPQSLYARVINHSLEIQFLSCFNCAMRLDTILNILSVLNLKEKKRKNR